MADRLGTGWLSSLPVSSRSGGTRKGPLAGRSRRAQALQLIQPGFALGARIRQVPVIAAVLDLRPVKCGQEFSGSVLDAVTLLQQVPDSRLNLHSLILPGLLHQ